MSNHPTGVQCNEINEIEPFLLLFFFAQILKTGYKWINEKNIEFKSHTVEFSDFFSFIYFILTAPFNPWKYICLFAAMHST